MGAMTFVGLQDPLSESEPKNFFGVPWRSWRLGGYSPGGQVATAVASAAEAPAALREGHAEFEDVAATGWGIDRVNLRTAELRSHRGAEQTEANECDAEASGTPNDASERRSRLVHADLPCLIGRYVPLPRPGPSMQLSRCPRRPAFERRPP